LVWLRLLGGLIGTILQTIQLITGTLRRNECLTKGSPLDILPRIMFNIIISSLSLLPLVITEKLARQKLHVPPLTAVETGLMVAPAAIASIKKVFQAKLVRHPRLQKSGLQGLQELQVVLAGILM
jgi:hypothetical protein